MFNTVFTAVWIGYIALAVVVWLGVLIIRNRSEVKKLEVWEEGETVMPIVCFDDLGDDTTAPKVKKLCRKCGKTIRNDRNFCSMKCKKAYLKGRK